MNKLLSIWTLDGGGRLHQHCDPLCEEKDGMFARKHVKTISTLLSLRHFPRNILSVFFPLIIKLDLGK